MYQEINNIRRIQGTDFKYYYWIDEDEWKLYIQLMLLKYMRGYIRKWEKTIWLWWLDKKIELIPFMRLVPKWWTCQRTHTYLIDLFRFFGDDINIIFHKTELQKHNKWETYDYENPLFDRFYNQNETSIFFQDYYFSLMESEIFEFIEISNDFDREENIDTLFKFIGLRFEGFISEVLSKQYNLISHEAQRNIVLNKIVDFHNLVWWIFRIQEKHFHNQDISLIYVMMLLWKLGYICIVDLYCASDESEFNDQWKYIWEKQGYQFDILITEKAYSLFEWLFEIKNLVINAIFDEEYKAITILKKDWKPYMFEWKREILWDDERFIDVVNKYPHSKIETDPYKWKINKYTVTEKIRLNPDNQ